MAIETVLAKTNAFKSPVPLNKTQQISKKLLEQQRFLCLAILSFFSQEMPHYMKYRISISVIYKRDVSVQDFALIAKHSSKITFLIGKGKFLKYL